MILLDTCAFIWLGIDTGKLTELAFETIKATDQIYVSPISLFEMAFKQTAKKLLLPLPALIWYNEMLNSHHITELPLTGPMASRAALLPLLHRDPADRFLIATAQEHHLSIITPDHLIRQYPDLRTIW